ncbi:MAG: porin family protein [Chitinophagaceae bacterium]
MKKIIVIAFVLSSTLSFAQVQFGIKAGANISNFNGGDFDAVKKKALVGFHGGVYLNFPLANLSIQPEAMISTQGAKIDSVSGSYNWKVTYVTVPVVLQYRFNSGFFLEAGPQVAFKISEDIENKTISNFAKDLDLAAVGGLGFKSKGGLGLGARYSAGISKVGDFKSTSGIDPDFKNGVIQVSLYIPLSGKK